MKKIISIILCAICLFTVAIAETDFSSMSTEELLSLISSAKNELLTRSAQEDGKVFLVNTEDYQIYLTGKYEETKSFTKLGVVFVNNTGNAASVHVDKCTVNGWETYCDIIGQTSGNSRKKDEFELKKEDADIESLADIETITFVLHTFESDTLKSVELGKVTIVFDGTNFIKVE